MKNILKKIGVFGLILAVLSPFVELPKVYAEEANCENYLQSYLFLDINSFIFNDNKTDSSIKELFIERYSSENGGSRTGTNFPYVFSDTDNVEIVSVTTNNLLEDGSIDAFWEALSETNNNLNSYNIDPTTGGALITSSKLFSDTTKSYDKDTILIHGVWQNFDEDNKPKYNDWSGIDPSKGKALSIQNKLDSTDKTALNLNIRSASFENNDFTFNNTELGYTYFQKIVDEGLTIWDDGSNDPYIPLSITRTINKSKSDIETMLNKYVFGYKNEEGVYVFSDGATPETTKENIKNSYTALRTYIKKKEEFKNSNKTEEEQKAELAKYVVASTAIGVEKLDFNTANDYYWPAVLNVEYKSCSNTSKKQWAVKYDDNVDDESVTNMPSPLTEEAEVGTGIKVSSTKPTRSGYIFKKWCEVSDGSGKCYDAGEEIVSETATTIPLFAQWQKSGTTDNPPQGVVSYIIGFAAVGLVAGGIYLISKKKNLFKQI